MPLAIADDAIRETERERVHRPRRRHADVPVAEAPRIFLHRRMRAGFQHFDGANRNLERRQESRVLLARAERLSVARMARR